MVRARPRLALSLLVLVVLAACVAEPGTAPPSVSAEPAAGPTSTGQLKPSPTPEDDGTYTVSEAIAARDAGELGSRRISLVGFWTTRTIPRTCVPTEEQVGELEVRCYDGEYGITEANEAIAEWVAVGRLVPASGPHLTPWMPNEIGLRLDDVVGWWDAAAPEPVPYPPVPIMVVGHFDDPRAADCNPKSKQLCRERFVIDEVVEFEPDAVPAPTPTPPPTPFPSPAPPDAFGPELCEGDVPYAFVGWTTFDELGIDLPYKGHVFAMVTKDPVPISEWRTDPQSGDRNRTLARVLCYTEDFQYEAYPEFPVMSSMPVEGTHVIEWEDGRREPD